MTTVEITLTTAVRDLLLAHLPAAVPSGTPVRAEADKAALAMPCFTVAAEGTEYLHPRLVRTTLTVRLETRADATSAADAAAWHQATCDELAARILTLSGTLAAAGFQLRRFMPAALSDAETAGEERRRTVSQSWSLHLCQ